MVEFGMLVWGLFAAVLCCALLGMATVSSPVTFCKSLAVLTPCSKLSKGQRARMGESNRDWMLVSSVDADGRVYGMWLRADGTEKGSGNYRSDHGELVYATSASKEGPSASAGKSERPTLPVKVNVPQTAAQGPSEQTAKVAPAVQDSSSSVPPPSTPIVSTPETSPEGVTAMPAKKLSKTDRIKAAQEERASKRREPVQSVPSLQEAESLLRGGGFSEDEVRVMVAALAARREGMPSHQNVTTPAIPDAPKSDPKAPKAPKVPKVRKPRGKGKPIVVRHAARDTSKGKASKTAKATTSSVAEGPFSMTERAFYMACRGHGLSAKETCEAAAGLKFAPNVKLANDSSYYNRKVTEKGGTIPTLSKVQFAECKRLIKAAK